MNLSQLERIVMVAKSGNITDVAQKLYISQPALSQTISTVEDEIGAPIFDRRAQPLKLTPEGEYFIHAARDILRANESMLQNIRNVRSGARGKITIGSSIPRCRSIWSHILPSMVESYPNVMLSFVDGKSTDFERMILLGSMDLGLSNSPPNNNRVGSFLLNEERYYLIANRKSAFAQALDKQRFDAGAPALPISLKVAKNERFILLDPQRNARIAFNHMVREVGFSPCIAIEAYNSDIALEYVEAGLGVALLKSHKTAYRFLTRRIRYPTLSSTASMPYAICIFSTTPTAPSPTHSSISSISYSRVFHSKSATNWEDSTTHTNAIG